MKKYIGLLIFLVMASSYWAQNCGAVQSDTMKLTGTEFLLTGVFMECTLKNQSVVRIFRGEGQKLYLRLVVTKNFYFNKVSTLEIQSGSKSFYVTEIRQHKIDKNHGLFITEIYRNYLATLKEYGITGIIFGGASTDFTRKDAMLVKEVAQCIYNTLPSNNHR